MTKDDYAQRKALYFGLCGNLVAEKIGIVPLTLWSNSDYIKLSFTIAKATKVYISANTLKRIFGKLKTEKSYSPQKASLDALAIFLGYLDWKEFENKNSAEIVEDPAAVEPDNKNEDKSFKLGRNTKLVIFFVAAFGTILCLWAWYSKNKVLDYSGIRLTCINPEGEMQHTAVFKLHLPVHFSDTTSFKLEFGNRFSLPMSRNVTQVLHSYDSPGWYQAILRHKNKAIDSVLVYVKSKGWYAGSSVPSGPERHRISHFSSTSGHQLHATKQDIVSAGIDTTRTFFVNYSNIRKTDIDGDNFELNAHIKTSDSHWACSQFNFGIYGQFSQDYIGIIKPECIGWADANFSEQIKSGEKHLLSSLGISLNKGGHIRLLVRNKFARFFVNGKLVYAVRYKKTIGKIWGFKMLFGGIGEVYSFSLRDLHTGELF